MSEQLRAYIAVMVLTVGTMLALRWLLKGTVLYDILERRRNAWLLATTIIFFSPNFFLTMGLLGSLYIWVCRKDPHPVGLYLMMLLAVPPWPKDIEGFGPFNQLFTLDHFRLMSLAILLPLGVQLFLRAQPKSSTPPPTAGRVTDVAVLTLSLYELAMWLPEDSATQVMRRSLLMFLDLVLPYFVISRYLRTREAVHDALGSLLLAGLILTVIGTFEHFKGWLLYEVTTGLWNIPVTISLFLMRDDRLRAMATSGHALVLGHFFVVCLALLGVFGSQFKSNLKLLVLYGLLALGLYATLSRGPLLAAATVLVLMGLFTGRPGRYYTGLVAASLLVLTALFFSPFWDKVVRILPFVGTVEVENVTYRQELFEATLMMIRQRPLFGTIHMLQYLEHLRQGQGIIDLVNTYAIYAMRYGLIGLTLFLLFLLSGVTFGVEVAARSRKKDVELFRAAGCTAMALLGSMIVIVAVSNINSVPMIYTALVGILVAMVRQSRPVKDRRRVLSRKGETAALAPGKVPVGRGAVRS